MKKASQVTRSAGKKHKSGFGRYYTPTNILDDVFPLAVREAWRADPTEDLITRLRILCASGPSPSDKISASELRYWKARKSAWETYLFTSFACGLFETRGSDLRSRLTGRDPDGFRGAMAECMACWFLAGKMKFQMHPEAHGRRGRILEMRVVLDSSEVGIEVKSPYKEFPKQRAWHGDDSGKIAQAMDTANKQFAKTQPNVLILVPEFHRSIFHHRRDLLKAAFGQSKITCQINMETGEAGPVDTKFFPDGRFLNTQAPSGLPLKPDGFPAYRRISALLLLEERFGEKHSSPDPRALSDEGTRRQIWPIWKRQLDLHFSIENEVWMDHDVLLLHNPYAYHSISQELFAQFPQLIPVGEVMKWTDGEEVIV